MQTTPAWLSLLAPTSEPKLAPVGPGSALHVWHVAVALRAWHVPAGQVLSGSDNWNGKALVIGEDSGLDSSVGEVEIATRLRGDGSFAAWTGKPRVPWSRWALGPDDRTGWFAEIDREVRVGSNILFANSRGLPDVLRWVVGRDDFCCVEYKGPSPTNPARQDMVKDKQVGWLASACQHGLLEADRIAVVTWQPSSAEADILRQQAAASKLGRSQRRGSTQAGA